MRRWALLVLGLVVITAGCSGVLGPGTTPTPTDETSTPASIGTTNGTLSVHFINVGQGAATVVVTPGNETVLVDSGDWRDDGEAVLTYLQRTEITHLDYLVTSHADADHIGGHAAIIEYFETEANGVGAVYDSGIASSSQTYEAYLDAVERHDVPLYRAQAGDSLDLPVANATVLAPPEGYLAEKDRNENSLVLRVDHGATSVLLPGDAAAQGEEYLTDTYGASLNATILQAGHHGSKTSTGEAFLKGTTPRVVVISSAYDSQYGHPHEEVLQRLADRAIPTFWTATHGTVVVQSDGRTVSVSTQQSAPTTADRLRDSEPVDAGINTSIEEQMRLTAGGNATTVSAPTTATDGGTETATPSGKGQLSLVEVHADATGDDRENLNDEYLVFENGGSEPLVLDDWRVADAAGHTYTVPGGVELAPGATVTLHTGSGTDTETDLYWGADQPVWNNGGDTVTVTTADGELVIEEAY